MFKSLILGLFSFTCFLNSSVYAWDLSSLNLSSWDVHGKFELAPALVDLDILESGKTIETLHMHAIRGDAILAVYRGISLKGGFTVARKEGRLNAGFFGVGQYLPITKKFSILPSVGISYSYLHTRIDLEEHHLFNLKEKFSSRSPYISMELSYSFTDRLSVTALYQYAWCRTHTTIAKLLSEKSYSSGSNYGLGIDYKIDKNWYVTFGLGYNISLTHEKHGLRAKGAKLGAAYYF